MIEGFSIFVDGFMLDAISYISANEHCCFRATTYASVPHSRPVVRVESIIVVRKGTTLVEVAVRYTNFPASMQAALAESQYDSRG